MYEAYEPDDPYNTFTFHNMGTLMRKFRGTEWRITPYMSSGSTHEIQITRPNLRYGGLRTMAVVRVPYAAVDAAHAAEKDPTVEEDKQ